MYFYILPALVYSIQNPNYCWLYNSTDIFDSILKYLALQQLSRYFWFRFEAFGSTTPYMALVLLQISLVPFWGIWLYNNLADVSSSVLRHLIQQPHIWLWFSYKWLWFRFEAFGFATTWQISLVLFWGIWLNNLIYGFGSLINVSGSVLRHLVLQQFGRCLGFHFEAFGSTTLYMTLVSPQIFLVPFWGIWLNNPIYSYDLPTNVSDSVLRYLALQQLGRCLWFRFEAFDSTTLYMALVPPQIFLVPFRGI